MCNYLKHTYVCMYMKFFNNYRSVALLYPPLCPSETIKVQGSGKSAHTQYTNKSMTIKVSTMEIHSDESFLLIFLELPPVHSTTRLCNWISGTPQRRWPSTSRTPSPCSRCWWRLPGSSACRRTRAWWCTIVLRPSDSRRLSSHARPRLLSSRASRSP